MSWCDKWWIVKSFKLFWVVPRGLRILVSTKCIGECQDNLQNQRHVLVPHQEVPKYIGILLIFQCVQLSYDVIECPIGFIEELPWSGHYPKGRLKYLKVLSDGGKGIVNINIGHSILGLEYKDVLSVPWQSMDECLYVLPVISKEDCSLYKVNGTIRWQVCWGWEVALVEFFEGFRDLWKTDKKSENGNLLFNWCHLTLVNMS